MSIFSEIKMGDPVELFAISQAFEDDVNENKVGLMHSAFLTLRGEPWTLPVVRQVERAMANDDTANKRYLPAHGLESFTFAATKLLLGRASPAILQRRTFSVQTLSGTGGMSMIAKFLCTKMDCKTVYNSNPTWEIYGCIFRIAGFEKLESYRYWCEKKRGLDKEGLLEDLRMARENSVIVLQISGHNPTGCDPTMDEWKQIAAVLEGKKLFLVLDCAFQGLASGDLKEDAWPVRHFISRGMEVICCQSFSNSFGLYNERVGNVTFVVNNESLISKIKSQLSDIILSTYVTPPNHGARIIACILNNPALLDEWKDSIKIMANRMFDGRTMLYNALIRLETPGSWTHIIKQRGMYSFLGLTEQQIMNLIQNYHIYLLRSGRINITNIRSSNIEYISHAIYDTIIKFL